MLLAVIDSISVPIISVIKFNSLSFWFLMIVLLLSVQLLWWAWSDSKRYFKAMINKVERLDDGSYCISWGYINNTGKPLVLNHQQSSLVVTNGAILLLAGAPPNQFEPGEHREVMKMVALENTEVEWIILEDRTKVVVNSTEKEGEESEIV